MIGDFDKLVLFDFQTTFNNPNGKRVLKTVLSSLGFLQPIGQLSNRVIEHDMVLKIVYLLINGPENTGKLIDKFIDTILEINQGECNESRVNG